MASSPPELGLKIMRGLFARGDKDGVPAELKRALSLLHLSGLEELEYRFLATEAFLKPWAVFRDSILVLKPDGIADSTTVAASDGARGISRTDILWFYTQFDEDMYRHDPWARDDRFCVYIDKKGWCVEEYEKHLFAWLLQTFKVGKAHNPWGFDYFQLRNICTAWQAVFVPIVNAVRASYSIKGRRHYGRLALFVEDRCPSGLSFPNRNVNTSQGNPFSTSPHRVLLPPKNNNGVGVLTRKHYDETEKELRTVYPQYGGLVERPKFKHKMEEWLEEQRVRANTRKAAERAREAKVSQSEVIKGDGSQTPTDKIYPANDPKGQEKNSSISPIRRVSNSIRRSLSRSLFKLTPPEQPKSPLHGVTRQLYVPDDLPSPYSQDEQSIPTMLKRVRPTSAGSSDTTIITPWPRPGTGRKSSEQSVYNPRRVSTPLGICNETELPREHEDANGSMSSRKSAPSGIPRPVRKDTRYEQQGACISPISDPKSYAERRIPSYEGSDWGEGISTMNPNTVRTNAGRAPEPLRPKKSTTRLPAPIKPTPYYGHLRVATEHSNCDASSRAFESPDKSRPKPVAWPGTSPADKSVLSAVNDQDDIIPSVPTKSPERRTNTQDQATIPQVQQRARSASDRSMTRIVSKENIRAALGGHSRDSSAEDVYLPPCVETDQEQGSGTTPRGPKLQTYNTHMFPRGDRRKGTPVGGWVGATRSRNATG